MSTVTTLVRTVDHLIDGAWVPPANGERFESRDPHDGALLGQVAAGDAEDARRAFDDGPWPRMGSAERRRLLHGFADLVELDLEELAMLDTRERRT